MNMSVRGAREALKPLRCVAPCCVGRELTHPHPFGPVNCQHRWKRPEHRQPQPQPLRALGAADLGSSSNAERERLHEAEESSSLLGAKSESHVKRPRGYRPRIAVDVDEVLAQFLLSLNSYYAERFGKQYHIEHYDEYYFCKVWNCSPEASNDIVHQFFESHHFRDGIVPVPGALDVLKKLQSKCDLVVVTSRQTAIQDATLRWIEAHYPGIFTELYFCNHFALEGESFTKAEIMKKHGIDMLIDDNKNYALESAEEGLDVILFGSYPWNDACADHEKIQRCNGWDDIYEYVKKKYVSLPEF